MTQASQQNNRQAQPVPGTDREADPEAYATREWRKNASMHTLLGQSQQQPYAGLYELVKPYTMIPPHLYNDNLLLAKSYCETVSGSIVECGTWKGGMAVGLMFVGGGDRDYYFYDSYEGLPPTVALDGKDAEAWQADKADPGYYDNCSADYGAFMSLLEQAALPRKSLTVTKGWFNETVPQYDGGPIAVLRLDGDWYESTLDCLNALYKHVVPGGCVIIDDYDTWDGCSRAVHDYLSQIKSTARIRRCGLSQVTYIAKIDAEG